MSKRWSASDLMALTSASYRQIDYWSTCGYLGHPKLAHVGTGNTRWFTDAQLRRTHILKAASDAGVDARRVAPLVEDDDQPTAYVRLSPATMLVISIPWLAADPPQIMQVIDA